MIPVTLSHPSDPLARPSGALHDALEPWCAVGATGTLRLFDPPGGAVYLTGGLISYAECPPACGLDRLLTASGRLSTEAWRAALATGRANRQVGDTLLRQGLLGPAELESLVLSALYGAAHFLFGLEAGRTRFEMGAGHVIGAVVALELRTVCAEVDRRHRLLADTWPDSKLDDHAVLPSRRLPGHHVTLTALQWEIVANADRRRTPVELARSLGRDTFATLLEVRRLARAGLVEPGRPGTATLSGAGLSRSRDAEAGDRAADAGTPDEENDAGTPDAPDGGNGGGNDGGGGTRRSDAHPGLTVPSQRSEPLPRRVSGTGPWHPRGRAPGPDTEPPVGSRTGRDGSDRPAPPAELACPDSALVRIRDALEALR